MTETLTRSLLLDPRVTHLLITLDGEQWFADMTVDGLHSTRAGFETGADAYRWLQTATACADCLASAA